MFETSVSHVSIEGYSPSMKLWSLGIQLEVRQEQTICRISKFITMPCESAIDYLQQSGQGNVARQTTKKYKVIITHPGKKPPT